MSAEPKDKPASQGPSTWSFRRLLWMAGIVVVALILIRLSTLPRLNQEEIRSAVQTTLQRETPASFLVSGTVDVVATTEVENTRTLFPGLINLNLGTTRSRVRVPGKVSYGFDVRSFEPEMVVVDEQRTLVVKIPPLTVQSVEPDLGALEFETEIGWARLPGSGEAVEREAMGLVNAALREQGRRHLEDSVQPRFNAAHALQRALLPILEAFDIPKDRLRIDLGDGMVLTLDSDRPIV